MSHPTDKQRYTDDAWYAYVGAYTHPVCLSSNYSRWDLYRKSELTTSRMPWNNPGFEAGRETQK